MRRQAFALLVFGFELVSVFELAAAEAMSAFWVAKVSILISM